MKSFFKNTSNVAIITVLLFSLLVAGCGGKESKKPLADWQIREFVSYTNIPANAHLERINFINMRNKFAFIKYDEQRQKDKNAFKLYREKTFSSIFSWLSRKKILFHTMAFMAM